MLGSARALHLCPLSLQVCGHSQYKDGLKKKNKEKREREKKKATRGLRATSLESSCYQGNWSSLVGFLSLVNTDFRNRLRRKLDFSLGDKHGTGYVKSPGLWVKSLGKRWSKVLPVRWSMEQNKDAFKKGRSTPESGSGLRTWRKRSKASCRETCGLLRALHSYCISWGRVEYALLEDVR